MNKDYIIPLEKIFCVPISKLIEPDSYFFISDKNDVPFLKGIKYYAYKDDMHLYINELSKMSDQSGKPIIFNQDEFGKYFLDYVVEYNSVNAIKFLYEYYHETYHFSLKGYNNFFNFNNKCVLNIAFQNNVYLTKMIANINDAKLFFDIYDTYCMLITNKHYCGPSGVFEQEGFLQVILESEHLFNSLFIKKEYKYIYSKKDSIKLNKEYLSIKMINPIINVCLRCALNHLDKYKMQALEILRFGVENNKKVLERLNEKNIFYNLNDLGGVLRNNDELIDILIVASNKVDDNEINELIDMLPKLENIVFHN